MKTALTYSLSIVTVLLSLQVWGQKFTATVNLNTVTLGQNFRLTYTLHTQGENFRLPQFKDFRILSGPSQSHSTQVVNGRVSSSISLSYILTPLREGKFTIPAAVATVEGKDVSSNTIEIEVLKPSAAEQAQRRQQEQQRKKEQQQMQENLYVKLHISKNKSYQGDQIIATYKIYTRLNVVHYQVDKWPAFNGFYSQEVNPQGNNQTKTEVINGIQYTTAILKQVVLSPQMSGKLEIPALDMKVVVRVPEDRPARSIFDMFNTYKDVEVNLRSNKGVVDVKPLPNAAKPKNYNGAVGSFNMEVNLDKNDVKVNEAINYTITFSGNGNIKLIKDPELELPPDFEVFDPKENTQVQTTLNGISGKKTYEYLIIPRHSGQFLVPSIAFSFFNPSTGKYETIKSDEYTVTVRKADGQIDEQGASVVRSVRKKDVALLGRDIRYIKTSKPRLREAGSVFFGTSLYWILLSIPAFLFVGFLIIRKRLKEMRKDVVGMNRRKAGKTASRHLSTAKKHLDAGEQNEFYEEVFRSLNQYVGMKLNIPVAELEKDTIKEKLSKAEVDSDTVQSFLSLLSECEMARYAPSAAMKEADLYQKASEIINKLESEIK